MLEQRFHTPLPLQLDVSVPSGSIEIESVDGEESYVSVDGGEHLLEQVRVGYADGRLSVRFPGRRLLGLPFRGEGIRVHATVPHGADVKTATASADASLDGRFRRLDAKSASGDVCLRGEVEQDVAAATVSGDARLERVGGDLRMQTVSGDLRTGRLGGSLEARSVSGDIAVDSLREGHATFSSVSGDVEVGIAHGSLLDVDAGSVSGDLGSEVPLASAPGDGDDGPLVVVRGRTVSGGVRIFRAA